MRRWKQQERDDENINVNILNGQILFETDTDDLKNLKKLITVVLLYYLCDACTRTHLGTQIDTNKQFITSVQFKWANYNK